MSDRSVQDSATMETIALLCTDGSTAAIEALRASVPLLAPVDRMIVVTVESPMAADTSTGTGFHLRPWTADPGGQIETDGDALAKQHVDDTISALGLDDAESMAIVGKPGPAICALAEAVAASVIVIGTSGRGGLRRAVVGSTADHVVRSAVCPVLVQAVGDD